jgi:DnaJ-class molecular chaperone
MTPREYADEFQDSREYLAHDAEPESSGVIACPTCHGEGVVERDRPSKRGEFLEAVQASCPDCDGDGAAPCDLCGDERATVYAADGAVLCATCDATERRNAEGEP